MNIFMTGNGLPNISINNPFKDASQGNADHFYNNLSFSPTVEELNEKIGSSPSMVGAALQAPREADEPMFGVHIREAAASVKKLLR
ncbi:MAG: hypothetical protein WBF30_07330 [Candidatus Acidiferrales bacterium]